MVVSPISSRPVCASDRPFLREVFATTRPDIALMNCSEAEKDAFLTMQFRAQNEHYARQYPAADFLIVLSKDLRIGRLYVHRGPEETRIVDISLLPEARDQGIGTYLIRHLQGEATRTGKPIRIHVHTFSAAIDLYRRLGFEILNTTETHHFMEWNPTHRLSIPHSVS